MKALLPAAGYGTRLYPLTKHTPKALLPVGERPLLEHLVSSIQAISAINEIVIVSNATFHPRFCHWRERYAAAHAKSRITVLNNGVSKQGERRGTVGDIAFALEQHCIRDDIVIVNADNFFSFALRPAYDFFLEQGNTIALRRRSDAGEAGELGAALIDKNSRVCDFREKCRTTALPFCSLGVYFFKHEIRQRLAEYLRSGNAPDRLGDFISWLHPREPLYGFVFEGPGFWYDIGTPESYGAARSIGMLLQEQRRAAAA